MTDIPDIRRRLALGHLGGYWYQQVMALCDDLEETRAALEYWRGGEAMRDLSEACRQLREAHAENEQLKQRIRALEESAADTHTLFDEEELTNDTRS